MFKRLKEYLTNNKKNSVGRPRLASKAMIKEASIEAVLALVLCATVIFSGAGVLTGKTALELLGINNNDKYKGGVTNNITYYGVKVENCQNQEDSKCIDNIKAKLASIKTYTSFAVNTNGGYNSNKN